MTRYEFMKKLEKGIKKMPGQERAEILKYYNEYFDEAGTTDGDNQCSSKDVQEREARVIQELGDPYKIAARLMAEYACNQTQKPQSSGGKTGVKYIWMIIVGICAAPIAVPVAVAIAAGILSILAVVLAIGLTFIALSVAFLISGVLLFGFGIVQVFSSPASGLIELGVGLMLLSFGMLAGVVFYLIGFGLIPVIAKGMGNLFKRIRG